jgi:hypothetical protein
MRVASRPPSSAGGALASAAAPAAADARASVGGSGFGSDGIARPIDATENRCRVLLQCGSGSVQRSFRVQTRPT